MELHTINEEENIRKEVRKYLESGKSIQVLPTKKPRQGDLFNQHSSRKIPELSRGAAPDPMKPLRTRITNMGISFKMKWRRSEALGVIKKFDNIFFFEVIEKMRETFPKESTFTVDSILGFAHNYFGYVGKSAEKKARDEAHRVEKEKSGVRMITDEQNMTLLNLGIGRTKRLRWTYEHAERVIKQVRERKEKLLVAREKARFEGDFKRSLRDPTK